MNVETKPIIKVSENDVIGAIEQIYNYFPPLKGTLNMEIFWKEFQNAPSLKFQTSLKSFCRMVDLPRNINVVAWIKRDILERVEFQDKEFTKTFSEDLKRNNPQGFSYIELVGLAIQYLPTRKQYEAFFYGVNAKWYNAKTKEQYQTILIEAKQALNPYIEAANNPSQPTKERKDLLESIETSEDLTELLESDTPEPKKKGKKLPF